MVPNIGIWRNVPGSLTFRVLLLLTLTIAPIGAIAVYQTSRLSQTLEERAIDTLIASTLEAATPKRVALERAIGAASAVSKTAQIDPDSASSCAAPFERAIDPAGGFAFAGLVTPAGLACRATALAEMQEEVLTGAADFSAPSPFVVSGTIASDEAAILIGHPVPVEGRVAHFVVFLAQPTQPLQISLSADLTPLSVGVFTRTGLTVAQSGPRIPGNALTQDLDLDAVAEEGGKVFQTVGSDGTHRVYSVVPIYGDLFYALASWSPETALGPGFGSRIAPWIFPIVMWLATLTITYVAINRLVVRHVRHIGRRMHRFARNRTLPKVELGERRPFEFNEMDANFRAMAEAILQDEAELENALHEKTLLLREVHHRVKNNLQLIASIMNMQIRKSQNEHSNDIIRRLQDRVLGLAAIHRQMYEAQTLDHVPADRLVDAILEQTIGMKKAPGVAFTRHLDEVTLMPDQAVPLALLTAEATSNALSYAAPDARGQLFVSVSLTKLNGSLVRLEVVNSAGARHGNAENAIEFRRKGLGAQLIDAFTRQLGGTLDLKETGGQYVLAVNFEPASSNASDSDGATGPAVAANAPAKRLPDDPIHEGRTAS